MIIVKVRVQLLGVMFRIELIRSRNEGAAALCLTMVVAPGSGLRSG